MTNGFHYCSLEVQFQALRLSLFALPKMWLSFQRKVIHFLVPGSVVQLDTHQRTDSVRIRVTKT
jgi:hypothetical protein